MGHELSKNEKCQQEYLRLDVEYFKTYLPAVQRDDIETQRHFWEARFRMLDDCPNVIRHDYIIREWNVQQYKYESRLQQRNSDNN